MPELQEALATDCVAAWSPGISDTGYQLERAVVAGRPSGAAEGAGRALDDWLRSGRKYLSLYDPADVAPAQRNVVIELPSQTALDAGLVRRVATERFKVPRQAIDEMVAAYSRMGPAYVRISAQHHLQLRVLVTDGRALLAWVGALQPESFSARQRFVFRRIVPALQRRLKLEAQLRTVPLLEAALDAALDRLPSEAFVIDAKGRVHVANAAGQASLARSRATVRERLQHALASQSDTAFELVELAASGLPKHYLAIKRAQGSARTSALAAVARSRFGLTKRETDVLQQVLGGCTNKQIAVVLGCAERTVEVHVGRLLAKCGVDTRSALVARICLEC